MKTNLRGYEIFLAVCNLGSMTAAASRLGISQAAVSQHVSSLERELGVSLLERGRREVTITPNGLALRYRIIRMFEELRSIQEEMKNLSGFIAPRLSIGIMHYLGHVLGPAIFSALKPHVECIEIRSGGSPNHRAALRDGKLDMTVCAALQKIEGISEYKLAEETFVLITPKHYSFKAGVVDLEELAFALPMARLVSRRNASQVVERYLSCKGIVVPRAFEFDHDRLLLDAVRRGEAWTINSPLLVLFDKELPRDINIMPLPAPVPTRTLALLARDLGLDFLEKSVAEECRNAIASASKNVNALCRSSTLVPIQLSL
jgi:DNA-binding transcriptional LysR family regulator